MANYQIRSKSVSTYRVLVKNCSREHAESVLKDLTEDGRTPSDLVLRRVFRG